MHLGTTALPVLVSVLLALGHDGAPVLVASGALVAAAGAGLILRDRRRVERDAEELLDSVQSWRDGDIQTAISLNDGPTSALRDALEDARRTLVRERQILKRQREELAGHLTRVEERLRDPGAEARRRRLARIHDLAVILSVGKASVEAAVVDLTVNGVVLAVRPQVAERLMPGLPVRVRVECGGATLHPVGVTTVAPARGRCLDLREWVFRFSEPLEPKALPSTVSAALELREFERVRPHLYHPMTATLVCDGMGTVPAQVMDVSHAGVGLLVSLSEESVGELGREITVQLHMPTLGRFAVVSSVVVNVAVSEVGTRLGLAFAREADVEELAKVGTWLRRADRMAA